jgi:nitronate monooxygenase
MSRLQTHFVQQVGIEVPLICGAMYPCSNPELVAAASEAGGIGIVQPISLTYVHGHKFREGLRFIRSLTDKPIGFNAIVEKSSKTYEDRMRSWIDIALEEDIRFFITALGKPGWVVEKVHAVGGIVYHDVTERKWAELALESGVDGLICVNSRAGGHAGGLSPEAMLGDLEGLDVPLICAGGVGSEADFVRALDLGYAGVQMGTRFIATNECTAHADYKQAILDAKPTDIVLTDKISGVPVAVINTPYIEKVGTRAGRLMRWMLRHPKYKHWARLWYTLKSIWQLKRASMQGMNYKDYFQAGKSVDGIVAEESAGAVIRRFAAAASQEAAS